ncbi:MAG: tetratricopeptide repeat protein [Bacteroidota bacterium]
MKPSRMLLLLAIPVYFAVTAFQCGSAEVTTARLAIQQQQWDKAEESLLREVTRNDKNEEAWFLLGQVRWEVKRYREANEAFTRALSISDAHAREISGYRLELWSKSINDGVNLYNSGRNNPADYDKAVELFTRATDVIPDSAQGHYYLALALSAKKDYAGAEQCLLRALAMRPDYPEAMDRLGILYGTLAEERRAAGDAAGERAAYEKALGILEQAHARNPSDPAYILSLVDVYEKTGQTAKALKLTSEAVAADPGNRVFRYAYGVFLLRQERYAEAVDQLTRVGKGEGGAADQAYMDAAYNTGVAYLNWGVVLKAEAEQKAEQETKARGRKDVKVDEAYKEKLRAALPYLEESTEYRREDAALWQRLAQLYGNLNMPDKMKAAFERMDSIGRGN